MDDIFICEMQTMLYMWHFYIWIHIFKRT